ncbi:hypothetical protein FACS1894200_07480 [Spirochaetia bacterium]|nr:hypothetical protein FACS1894200_07480 [Spirochaetia bacterium]
MGKELLLHACCGPCALHCLSSLYREDIRPDLYWYNPNIHPFTEYRARRDTLTQLAQEEQLALHTLDEYGLRLFINALSADAQGPTFDQARRCPACYAMRLIKTAAYAAEQGYRSFSTTLLASPYQKHERIVSIGRESAARYGLEFFYRDWRPHFHDGQRSARERGYYMQKYCGCIFSEEERYTKKG